MKVMALVPNEFPRNWFAPLVGSAISAVSLWCAAALSGQSCAASLLVYYMNRWFEFRLTEWGAICQQK
jgi:hypothetical protein